MTRLRTRPSQLATHSVAVGLALVLASTSQPEHARSDPAATPDPVALSSTLAPVTIADRVTATPTRWLPTRGRECARRGRYRGFCQGPRRAPVPEGPAAALARDLGLGDVKTVSHILLEPPRADWVAAAGAADAAAPELLWPVPEGKLWRGFGRPTRRAKLRRRHRGIDIGAPDGTPIRAAQNGLVAYSDNGVHGYGNLLVTVHPDASVAFYAHCQAIYVFPGQHVQRGQVVAEVGHTGIARGSHLHFEYRVNGRPRDPVPAFDATSRESATALNAPRTRP